LSSAQKSKPRKRKSVNEGTSKATQSRKKRKTAGDLEQQRTSKSIDDHDTHGTQLRASQERSSSRAHTQSIHVEDEPDPDGTGSVQDAAVGKTVTRPKPRKRGKPRASAIPEVPKTVESNTPVEVSDPAADDISGSSRDDPKDNNINESEAVLRHDLYGYRDQDTEKSGEASTRAVGSIRKVKNTMARVEPTRKQPSRTASQKRT
jgi:hypothetical protein